VRNPSEVAKVAQKAGIALRQHRVITRDDVRRTYEAVFSWREGLLLALLSGAVLAFAILAFDKASGLSAQERRDIGILKAIGWDTNDILRMKLWEATLIAGTACAAGVLLAYAHVFFFSAPLIEPVLKGWSTLYPRFVLTPEVDGLQLTTLALLCVLPYLAAVGGAGVARRRRRPRRGHALSGHLTMIELTQVSKHFHEGQPNEMVAVRDISLRLPAGQVTVLQGPSGSGKTTLLTLIGCLARPTQGRCRAAAGPAALGLARSAPGAGAAADFRLCLPALQPHPGPEHAATT
jgi:ABC-type multidrug transport system fused ATPase/permease subunit